MERDARGEGGAGVTVKEYVTLATKLSQALLRFDEDNPGDSPGEPDATVEVPADVWADWIDLAWKIDESEAPP
jgi:hypothetical protein